MFDRIRQAGVITDIVLLSLVGVRTVLVHGGGPEINSWLDKVGACGTVLYGMHVLCWAQCWVATGAQQRAHLDVGAWCLFLLNRLRDHTNQIMQCLCNRAGSADCGSLGVDRGIGKGRDTGRRRIWRRWALVLFH